MELQILLYPWPDDLSFNFEWCLVYLCVPLLNWKSSPEKKNSFGNIVDIYVESIHEIE